jgi:hypothetical protein
MKIVDRKTFLALPPETLFSKYGGPESCVIGELLIKGETWTNDFLYQEIVDSVNTDSGGDAYEIIERAEKSGESFAMDFNCLSRDGLFDQDQLFLVWEKADVDALKERLSRIP